MKYAPFLIAGFFAAPFALSAKVITVNNNPNSPGQYSSLQQALDSASAGDTLYVHGSATSYGNVVIKKRIKLFGTGHKPNKANTLVSELGSIQFDTVPNVSGGSGSLITGFKLNYILGYSGAGGTKNVTIRRNYFLSGSTKISLRGSGWVVEHNVIEGNLLNLNNYPNTTIRNNVFYGCHIFNSNQSTVVVSNNVFLGNLSTTAFATVSNALIANNIFSGASPKGTSVDNNSFANNLTYQTSYDTIPFGSNIGNGNFVAMDPKFTNVPNNTFNYSYNYSLSATSPGKNAGTDGKDLGIFGGFSPVPDLTGTPNIPQLKSLMIINPVISVGDSIQVIIKGKKQD